MSELQDYRKKDGDLYGGTKEEMEACGLVWAG